MEDWLNPLTMKTASQSIRWFTTLTILFLGVNLSLSQSRISVSGSISSDDTWTADTVDITGDVIVEDGITLTIAEGTLVAASDYYSIRVKGRLLAIGTVTDTIRFERMDSTGWHDFSNTGGGWAGIIIDNNDGGMNNNDSTVLKYCKVRFGKASLDYGLPYVECSGAGLNSLYFSKLVIEDCLFECNYSKQGGGAVYLRNSGGRITDNGFLNNVCPDNYGGAFGQQNSNTVISGNLFAGNYAKQQGGAIYISSGYALIRDNEIRDNSCWYGGGAIGISNLGGADILSNEIYHNKVERYGGAFFLQGTNTRLAHNDIYENETDPSDAFNSSGGAFYIFSGSVARLDSNLIHDNINRGPSGGALWSNADTNVFIGNEFYNNSTNSNGGAIFVNADNLNTILKGNKVYGNSGTVYAGGIQISGENAEMEGNEIHHNTGVKYGGGIAFSGCVPVMKNNLVANNNSTLEGGGIHMNNTNGEFVNNILVNNESKSGGALFLKSSNPVFINNTVCMNLATNASSGGAVTVDDQCVPRFHNDLFYGNEADAAANQFYFTQMNPVADFYNCNIEGGKDTFNMAPGSVLLGTYQDNLDVEPGFEVPTTLAGNADDGTAGDWRLAQGSACINMGTDQVVGADFPSTDYNGDPRVRYSYADIGAFEYSQVSYEVCGNISTNTTWTADTVRICGNTHVLDNVTLTIHPGVYVKFLDAYTLEVSGALRAIGTPEDSIVFTIDDTTDFSNPGIADGGWTGIYFSVPVAPVASEMAYCRIDHVKGTLGSRGAVYVANAPMMTFRNSSFRNNMANNGAAIKVYGSAITVSECRFSNNVTFGSLGHGPAIYLAYSNSIIENSVFENNTAGGSGAIYMTQSHPKIYGNTFTGNYSAGDGGAIRVFAYSSPEIKGNVLLNNVSGGDGGGIYTDNKCSPRIILNHIANNQSQNGGGIFGTEMKSSSLISGNLIANNSAVVNGGGIFLDASPPSTSSNTLVNNLAAGSGGGMYSEASVPIISHSILWENEDGSGENALHILNGNGTSIRYCDIQGGSGSVTGGSSLQLENNVDTLPVFAGPSGGTGAGFSVPAGGWMILSTSPLINSGNRDDDGLYLPDEDLLGNERIHDVQIDIGALENQAGLPVITLQPGSLVKCSGEEAIFTVHSTDSVNYQWMKNGTDLPGLVSASLVFDSVGLAHQASYQCRLSNAYGTNLSSPVLLQVKERPEILASPQNTWARAGSPVTLELFARGTELNYQWQKDGTNIPGAVIPKLTILNPGTAHEGTYACIISNTCGKDTSHEATLYMAPQLCMITVDESSGHNLVVWEKQSSAPILAFNVYRESMAAGIYDLIETVPYDALSVLEDTTANPAGQAYLYKITAIDSADEESDIDLCRVHKTIHLLVSTNPELNVPQLEWDKYYGFEYSTYDIYRSDNGVDFSVVHSISSSLNSWTDLDAPEGVNYYRIGVVKPDTCFPTGGAKKAGTGPYSHALSNMDDNKLKEGEGNQSPTDLYLSNNTIQENLSVGALVGRLSTEDPDTSDHHIYKLVSGIGDTDNQRFTTLGDMLITAEVFDYEAQDTLYVRIKSVDKGDLSIEKEYTILVTDINEEGGNLSPTGISLSYNSIDENQPVGTLVGRLTTEDPNSGDSHTYRLVDGTGGEDNASFTLLSDLLISA